MKSLRSDSPLVSVLIPVYNYGKYVTETVRSIWAQEYRPIEIVAVDDGSSDNSFELLEALAAKSPIKMVVLKSEHVGVSGAMQLALDHAEGEFIAVVHADDIHLESKIALQVQALMRNSGASLSHTEYRCIDELGNELGQGSRLSDLPAASGESLVELLELKTDVRSVSMLYRKSCLVRRGGYDADLPNEDWHSILRLAAEGSVIHIDEELVLRRIHSLNRHINVLRRPKFVLNQIAPKVLLEVCPEGYNLDRLFVRHIGSIISSSIGSGNFKKGCSAFNFAIREYGLRYTFISLQSVIRGLISFSWTRFFSRLLPRGISSALRRVRRHLRVRKLK